VRSVISTLSPVSWIRAGISIAEQRIGAMDLEKIAGRQRLQRLPRLQGRQGAFEAGKVKPGMGHR